MKSINNKFWISKAIAPAFRLFDWLNFHEFEKVEVQCHNLEQGKIFLEAFLYFYDNNVQLNLTQAIKKREVYYLQPHEHRRSTGHGSPKESLVLFSSCIRSCIRHVFGR